MLHTTMAKPSTDTGLTDGKSYSIVFYIFIDSQTFQLQKCANYT